MKQIYAHDPTMDVGGEMLVNGHYNSNALLSEQHYDKWMFVHSMGKRPLARYKVKISVIFG